ncbi:hypothetical protein [Vibrio harveyi]|uniref:hypothetical protein n=1 Tax=Vibrio harveyi TaxID=669 RepID=UPI003BB49024
MEDFAMATHSKIEKIIVLDVEIPKLCHEHDKIFIAESLVKLPVGWRQAYCDKYAVHFLECMAEEKDSLKKQGIARRKCNNWLRHVIRKYEHMIKAAPNENNES